jgi:formamidopyrimidine-DNA glycosylase
MPELPEVETVRRSLNISTCDRQIINSEILLERTIAIPNQQEFQLPKIKLLILELINNHSFLEQIY